MRMTIPSLFRFTVPLTALLAVVLLAACSTRQGHVRFDRLPADVRRAAQTSLPPLQADAGPLSVYPIDFANVFVHGSVETRFAGRVSLLLRSTDEGRTWTEVLPPRSGAEVAAMQFASAITGWLALDTGDAVAVYHTEDRGQTWQRLGGLAKESAEQRVLSLRFSGASQGQIRLGVPRGRQVLEPAVFESRNGGNTWRLAYRPAPYGLAETDPHEPVYEVAQDGTMWRIKPDAGNYQVVRCMGLGYICTPQTVLPGMLIVRDGRLSVF